MSASDAASLIEKMRFSFIVYTEIVRQKWVRVRQSIKEYIPPSLPPYQSHIRTRIPRFNKLQKEDGLSASHEINSAPTPAVKASVVCRTITTESAVEESKAMYLQTFNQSETPSAHITIQQGSFCCLEQQSRALLFVGYFTVH